MNVYSKLISFMSSSSNIISAANHLDELDHRDKSDANQQSSPCSLSSSQTDIQNVQFHYDYFQQSDENETSSDEETKENRKRDSSNFETPVETPVETPTEEQVEIPPVSTHLVCTNSSNEKQIKPEECMQLEQKTFSNSSIPTRDAPSTEHVQILTTLRKQYNNNINALQSQIEVLHYQVQVHQKQLKHLMKWVAGSLAMGFSTILFMFLKRK